MNFTELCHCNIISFNAYYIGNRINGYAFLSLNESKLTQFGVSYGFNFTLMNIIENLVCDITSVHPCITDVCTVYRRGMKSILEAGRYCSYLQQPLQLHLKHSWALQLQDKEQALVSHGSPIISSLWSTSFNSITLIIIL